MCFERSCVKPHLLQIKQDQTKQQNKKKKIKK